MGWEFDLTKKYIPLGLVSVPLGSVYECHWTVTGTILHVVSHVGEVRQKFQLIGDIKYQLSAN